MSVREKTDRPKLQLHHRPVEIERKFLVTNDEWKQLAVRSVKLRDGLITAYKDRKVRVRIDVSFQNSTLICDMDVDWIPIDKSGLALAGITF